MLTSTKVFPTEILIAIATLPYGCNFNNQNFWINQLPQVQGCILLVQHLKTFAG
ncbi:MAG: hypothetical protein AAF383_15635 [Cyanobacteria bacterium P01_A01_bin.83]